MITALLALALTQPTLAEKPSAARAAFFKADRVVRLDLTVSKTDFDLLRNKPREYVPATLKEDGKEVSRTAAIHLRGSQGSFRNVDQKPGLTVNMTKLGGKQAFHGMTKFHLLNCVQDPTYVQELICGDLMSAAGVPAARIAQAVVTLNGRVLGFYALKEGYDKGFLREHFQSARGDLYDGGFLKDIDQQLERSSGGEGAGDQADLKALVAASREPDHAKRLEKLGKLLEMDHFLALMALDVFTANWDGYPAKANNYRVYHDPKTGKITFIPSGMDQMFGDPNYYLFAFGGQVARSIIETKRGKELYLAKARTVMNDVVKPKELHAKLRSLETRIRPVLREVDKGAADGYADQIRGLRDAIDRRVEGMNRQLKENGK